MSCTLHSQGHWVPTLQSVLLWYRWHSSHQEETDQGHTGRSSVYDCWSVVFTVPLEGAPGGSQVTGGAEEESGSKSKQQTRLKSIPSVGQT